MVRRLPEPCNACESGDHANCEAKRWQRLHGGAPESSEGAIVCPCQQCAKEMEEATSKAKE